MIKNFVGVTFFCAPLFAMAQDDSASVGKWNLGLGVSATTSLYVGQQDNVMPFPLLSYEGERFFLRGNYGGIHLLQNDFFSLSAIISGEFGGVDTGDLRRSDLTKRGLRRDQLEDRKMGADAGIEATISGRYGVIGLQAISDVSGASKSSKANLNYSYIWHATDKWTFTPGAGVTWLSDKRANYYFGTLDKEVDRGVTSYKPDSLIIPHVSFSATYAMNDDWNLSGTVAQQFLPNKATDGPLVDKDKNGITTVFFGVARKF